MLRSTLGAIALAMIANVATAGVYTVTVTNNLDEELLAPILITSAANDGEIFLNGYVTPEAENQVLTGDPGKLVARIGPDAMVGKGSDGPPGVLLAAGKSVTFQIETEATAVRVFAMVAPTLVPDNFVTNVIDLQGGVMVETGLIRFDIGFDEGTMKTMLVGDDMTMREPVATVKFEKVM